MFNKHILTIKFWKCVVNIIASLSFTYREILEKFLENRNETKEEKTMQMKKNNTEEICERD